MKAQLTASEISILAQTYQNLRSQDEDHEGLDDFRKWLVEKLLMLQLDIEEKALLPKPTMQPNTPQPIKEMAPLAMKGPGTPNCPQCGQEGSFHPPGVAKSTGRAYKAFYTCRHGCPDPKRPGRDLSW